METVAKKKRRAITARGRLLILLLAVAAVVGLVLLERCLTQEPDAGAIPAAASTSRSLFSYAPEDVTAITVQRLEEAPWTVDLDPESGLFVLAGENGFTLTENETAALRDAAHTMICEAVLADDPAEYADHLADFGLDDPDRIASITFSDGRTLTLRVGNPTAGNAAWYYTTMDGDDCLYALGQGFVDALFVSEESLWEVTQPVIHRARIDRITLLQGDGSIHAEWTLLADITASDALDRWQITSPFSYPASSDSMSTLLKNTANLRLGAYVGPATPENLTLYGFDAPRMTIEIHMAAGTIGTTNMDGAFTTEDWPENTVRLTIGGQRSDMVDYVRYEDGIYVSSHFTMGVFLSIDPRDSMNRYPVMTALGNLAALTIEKNGETTHYALTRNEQVAENNELIYDETGSLVYDVTVTRNGEAYDYAAFEAAYEQLITISVTGVIPDGDAADNAPHTIYTFTDVDGTVHTVALHSYGVLHDAIAVDGHQAFYISKGAFTTDLE